MAKQAGYNSYIAYKEPGKSRINFNSGLEAFQRAQLANQRQQQKRILDSEKTYAKTSAELYDFTTGISPSFSTFVANAVSGQRLAKTAEYDLLKNGRISHSQFKVFSNNQENGWKAFMEFGKNYDKTLAQYVKNENDGTAGPMETQYFAPLFAENADFKGKEYVSDANGNPWMVKYDKNRNIIESESGAVNMLNNEQAQFSPEITVEDYAKEFTDKLGKFKNINTSEDGKVTTLEGMALMSGGSRGKSFIDAYDNVVERIYKAALTNPNRATNMLFNYGPPGDNKEWFFYHDKGKGDGQFFLNERDKEFGFFVNRDTDLHRRVQLTEGQKNRLREAVIETVNSQLGFQKSERISQSIRNKYKKDEEGGYDISLALKMRAGDRAAWTIGLNQHNAKSKPGDAIVSYRVAGNGNIFVSYEKDQGDETQITFGDFTGKKDDYDVIKEQVSTLMQLSDPSKFKSLNDAKTQFEDSKYMLPAATKMDAYSFKGGDRGRFVSLSEAEQKAFAEELSYVPVIKDNGPRRTNVATNVNKFIGRMNSAPYNFDPITGGKDKEVITSAQLEYEQGGSFIPAGPSGAKITNLDSVFKNKLISNPDTKVQLKLTVRGGPDGTDLQVFTLPLGAIEQGADANASEFKTQFKTVKEMLNFDKEPIKGKAARGLNFSDVYDPGLFKLKL